MMSYPTMMSCFLLRCCKILRKEDTNRSPYVAAHPIQRSPYWKDYTPPDINIGFNPIPIGTYYRAELHNGT